MAAFFGEAAFLVGLGLAVLAAGFLADFGLLAAGAFLTLGAPAGLAVFFGLAVLFLAAPDFAVVALTFGFTSRGFLGALVALADFGVELDPGFAALTFLGLAGDVALADLTAVLEAAFLAFFGPGDFDEARFLVPVFVEPALPLEALFLGFLLDFFAPLASLFGPSLNDPLAPLPLVCLKY